VVVTVDLNHPDNQGTPEPMLEEGELIQLRRVPLSPEGLRQVLQGGNHTAMPHMGLYQFAIGLELGMSLAETVKTKE
jgi:hypothetical protein